MNPDTTPTPRTDAARPQNHDRITSDWVHYSICGMLERELAEKTNEAARLREELDRLKRGCQGSCYACEPVGEMNLKLEAEVARLSELLNRAEHSASLWEMDAKRYSQNADYWRKRAEKAKAPLAPSPEEPVTQDESSDAVRYADYILNHYDRNSEKDKLCLAKDLLRHGWNNGQPNAPTPEETETSAHIYKCIGNVTEPANPTCANTTHKFSHCDCKQPSEKDTSTETCPSQKDTKVSVKEPHVHGCVNPKEIVNEWREIGPDELIQEGDEVQPKRHSKNGKWIWVRSWELGVKAGHIKAMRYRTRRPLPVKEEIPLEGDIASIEWSCAHTAKAIRYLRDEIQKLKQK